MECRSPFMIELNGFFIKQDSHLKIFTMTLPEIYQEHLCENVLHKQFHIKLNTHYTPLAFLWHFFSEINEITQEPFKEEELQEPIMHTARYNRTSPIPSTGFVKPRCIYCGLT